MKIAVGLLAVGLLATGCQGDKPGVSPGNSVSALKPGVSSTKTCHAIHYVESDPQAWLPDPKCSPGAVNPAVTLGMLCPIAHTSQWRPPASYTNNLKIRQLAQYDYVDSQGDHSQTRTSTEEDHIVSLELGGAPQDPANLWPEPHQSWNEKDSVESAAHDAVCRGALTLPQAQQAMMSNWYELGKRLGVKFAN
jgi:hypothetical protein